MAGETLITVVGNLTADPELRFTNSGVPVVSFNVASTPRTFDKQTNEWRDGEPMFLRCTAWRDMAENVAESLTKGARAIVQGNLGPNNYTDKDGNARTTLQLQVVEVGPALRYATAQPVRAQRGQQRPQQGFQQGQGFQGAPQGSQGQQGDPWSRGNAEEPPPF